MQILHTASEVIDALGGTAKVAALTDASQQSVSNWRRVGRLPCPLHLIMLKELHKVGADAPLSLWGIREPV